MSYPYHHGRAALISASIVVGAIILARCSPCCEVSEPLAVQAVPKPPSTADVTGGRGLDVQDNPSTVKRSPDTEISSRDIGPAVRPSLAITGPLAPLEAPGPVHDFRKDPQRYPVTKLEPEYPPLVPLFDERDPFGGGGGRQESSPN